MGFPRQENWSELPFPSPRDLPHPGIESLCSTHVPAPPVLVGKFFTTEPPGKPTSSIGVYLYEVSTLVTFIEMERIVVASGLGGGEMESYCLPRGTEFQLGKMKSSGDGGGDDYTTVSTSLVPLSCILENDNDGKFYVSFTTM